MKKLSKVVVGLLLVSSCSFASTMSQNDKDMIFKNQNVNFELLSNQEMKETEGEWIPAMLWAYRGMSFATRYVTYSGATMPATYYRFRSYFR